ncbi:hypothetical protein KUV50_00585 [Membranicola marinus]|uniref:Asparagine synthetase domain-containing protein n=1 Tax=Membranihabitans marinus TaxID=1227546 RepID=A0A953LBG7_9BACT|nr:asparagine synthase-related protein [Membranihabitans marinus]MBY5956609.1 hypothetical protein [Membranihabitans marinus]
MVQNKLSSSWKELTNHLGGVYPFYKVDEPVHSFSLNIKELLITNLENDDQNLLDLVSLISRIYLPYIPGDRTLIKNIHRAPWMSHPENNKWQEHPLPPHKHSIPDRQLFTVELKTALLQEVTRYINSRKTIGILLSGGMDSRILAGIVREYQNTIDPDIIVTGISWGDTNSRDVAYAQRIALQFNWEWQHIKLSAETLYENIRLSSDNGSEVAPFHYHGMDEVSKIEGLDLILAGSYGDSIGRGEYSGTHITNLSDISFKGKDRFGILKSSAKKKLTPILEDELSKSSNSNKPIRRREIQQQQHYLRRMLQSCMIHITKSTPLYQIFTAPDVFGKMWALDPSVRDDQWYILLLKDLPGNLLNIPWARTGLPYGQNEGEKDNYTKSYHSYGQWLRNDLRNEVIEAVNSSTIRDLGIFNNKSLDQALSLWSKATTRSVNYLDELFSWMASLKIFLEEKNIKKPKEEFPDQFQDRLNTYQARIYGELYIRTRNHKRS